MISLISFKQENYSSFVNNLFILHVLLSTKEQYQ
jgi:hypothetical protein